MKKYKIRICGKEWTIEYKKGIDARGQFTFKNFLIEIDRTKDAQYQRESLLHEVFEVIIVANDFRYESPLGANLFAFYHSDFIRMVSELDAVIKQLQKLKLL